MAFTLQTYVTDPTLLPPGELPEYVTNPTLTPSVMPLPAFVTNPTLVPPFELPEYVTAPAQAGPGIFRQMAYFTKTTSAVVGATGSMSKTRAYAVKVAAAVPLGRKSLEQFRKTMTGVTGVAASMNKTMGGTAGNGALSFTKTMQTSPTGTMSRTPQLFRKTTVGVTGVTGDMSGRTTLMWQKSGFGAISASATMSRQLLMFQKNALAGVATGSTWSTFSMHTERQALSQYTNFQFNSFCIFNGKVYGASDAGLFEITGANDNGTPIAARVAGGISDFGDSHLKTIDRAYAGYRTNGDITLSLITHDDGKQYDYPLPSTGVAGIYGRRVITGRGLRARYYQWQISNVNGASMYLDNVELSVTPLSRRIGGADS